MSPRSARRSPEPSIPDPAALTTRNGLSITILALDLASSSHDLVTASTPLGTPAKTALNSLSYWLATLSNLCQVPMKKSVITRHIEA